MSEFKHSPLGYRLDEPCIDAAIWITLVPLCMRIGIGAHVRMRSVHVCVFPLTVISASLYGMIMTLCGFNRIQHQRHWTRVFSSPMCKFLCLPLQKIRQEASLKHDFSLTDAKKPEFKNRNRYRDVSPCEYDFEQCSSSSWWPLSTVTLIPLLALQITTAECSCRGTTLITSMLVWWRHPKPIAHTFSHR